MLKKIISTSIFISLFTNPVFADHHEHHHEHNHKHHHDMKMNFHYHKMDENTIKMMKENYESSKLLFSKGVEIVKESSKKSLPEKILEGLSLLKLSMDVSYHPAMKRMLMPYQKQECEACKVKKDDSKRKQNHECKECSLQRKEHDDFLKKLGYSKEEHEKMVKDLEEIALIAMNTGNKLIQEGNKENNTSKMEIGAKLIKEAFMLHHKNKMIHIEKKVIIK